MNARLFVSLALAASVTGGAAQAQINWGLLQQPNYGANAAAAYAAGQRAAAERAAAQREAEAFAQEQQIRAQQARQIESQRQLRSDALSAAVKGDCTVASQLSSATGDPVFVRETLSLCAQLSLQKTPAQPLPPG